MADQTAYMLKPFTKRIVPETPIINSTNVADVGMKHLAYLHTLRDSIASDPNSDKSQLDDMDDRIKSWSNHVMNTTQAPTADAATNITTPAVTQRPYSSANAMGMR